MKPISILIIIFITLVPVTLHGYELRLHLDKVYTADDEIFADVYVNSGLNSVIKRYADNGIVLVFNYRIDLVKKNFLLDETVKQVYFYRKIYYDFFTTEYVVLGSETMREARNTNLYVLLKNVYDIRAIPIIKEAELNDNSKYYVRTRLSMQLENAYPYLSVFFNLITPLQYRIKWLDSEIFTVQNINNRSY